MSDYYPNDYIGASTMKAKLFDIVYDDDGEEWDRIGHIIMPIPKTLRTKKLAEMYVWAHGADYISDKTGWCVKGFNFDVVRD